MDEEQAYYSDQSTYDEEDHYMDEFMAKDEEDYGSEASIEEINPKPPDYDSDQSCDTRSSTWSKPYLTPYTSNSVIYVNPCRQSAPKVQLYAFSGKRSYLEWEANMDDWFYYNNVKEEKRLAYAIEQLSGEVYKWWVQEKAERRKYREPTITTWKKLKELLRKRYAPKRRNEAFPSKARSERERKVAGQNKADHVRVRESSNQNRKIDDQRSKQQALHLQAELRKQNLDDDFKNWKQEMLEILEALQKEKQVTHQSANTKANTEIMVQTEKMKAKSNSQPKKIAEPTLVHNQILPISLESSCELKQCKSSNFSKYKGATCYTCREKGHIAATCPGKIDLNINSAEPKLSSSNSNSEVVNDDLEHSNSCVMHLFLSKGINSGHTLEHESDKAKESTQEKTQLVVSISSQASLELYPTRLGIKVEQSKLLSTLMLGTQVSLAYESTQYFNNIIFTCSLKQPVLHIEISSIMHLILSLSAKKDAGSMHKCNSLEGTTRSLPTNQTEQPTHLVQEPILLPFPCDYPRKHCKEIDLVENGPNLFVIVSEEEEKCFGLENVKEFCVSSTVFDKMIPSFETLTLEKFSMLTGFMANDLRDFSSVSLCKNLFDMLRTETECALFRTWCELDYLLKISLIEPYKLKHHVLELNHSKTTLDAIGNESKLDHLSTLFVHSKRTFDVVSLVLIKERQIHDSRAKIVHFLSHQVDYGPIQQLSYHFMFWNWKYLRKETSNRGSRTVFKQTRREDDQRFKPPDLVQTRRLNLHLFIQIKEEPPDATSTPKTRFYIFGGNFLILVHFMITYLLYFHADLSDLRSNPFQVGGDDMIMGSSSSVTTPPKHGTGRWSQEVVKPTHTLMLEMSIQED